jgi:hypothetical protein
MKRLFCEQCQQFTLVVQRKYTCCDKDEDFDPDTWKRECDADSTRAAPPKWVKEEILTRQDHRCLYCERLFGSWAHRGKKAIQLQINWDHFSPYSYSRDNGDGNFVAACQICNGIKSNKLFDTLEQAKIYIASQKRFDDE